MSLRDVERAMIVFEYMFDMMAIFGPLMDEWAMKEKTEKIEESGCGMARISIYAFAWVCTRRVLQVFSLMEQSFSLTGIIGVQTT